MMNRKYSALLILTLLSGCAAGPDYKRPSAPVPESYKEARDWKVAQPQDNVLRGKWWEMYGDAELNALVQEVSVSNQNIRVAEAQYREALALLDQARTAYFPLVTAGPSASRAGGGNAAVPGLHAVNTAKVSLGASWEPDLWGSIRRNVESNEASARASQATLQAALLSAQSALVQSYLQLRVNDADRKLLEETIEAYKRSLQITRDRYEAGVAARVDVAQAQTQLESAEAQRIDLGVQRAELEHAIAVLVGKPPADFEIRPVDAVPAVPDIPAGLPSDLLERRPDIAAAERNMAATNAQIGVARAAYFPALTLSGAGGFQSTSFYQLMTLPNRFWSLGPSATLTLLDGGARSAQENKAVATYDQSVAAYRQTVLTAFQEVEDNLAALRILAKEEEALKSAEQLAAEALNLTNNQYQSGTVSYLNVVAAQTTALSAAQSRLNAEGKRLVASVVLLAALGGGWHAPQ
jgi:NodT family efflux transporter outer membrane factor (OMF) lipoprotein